MHSPIMLTSVKTSPKVKEEIKIVATSLNIPHTLNVTTEVRLMRKNSDTIIKKARLPPARMTPTYGKSQNKNSCICYFLTVCKPSSKVIKKALWKIWMYPSTRPEMINRMMAWEGARKKMDAKGLVRPILSFLNNTSVRDHRRPPKTEAPITWMKPIGENSVSSDTIRITPTVMMTMMSISFHWGFSNLNRNANINTKANVDDLHMASKRVI